MLNGVFKKGGLAALALSCVALIAWKAPEPNVAAAPAASAVSAPISATTSIPVASYAPVVEHVMPAVVTIRVEKRAQMVPTDQQIPDDFLRRFFGEQAPDMPRGHRIPRGIERGLGSGVIVTQDGYILTNNHVVDGADTVKVELPDNRTFTAKVVGTDPATDLAVVKIDAKTLPTLPLGDSDSAKIGDVVLAVGNPLGVGETVTAGIISAKGRQTPDGSDSYQDFIQTDAPINHGNSGGALVNTSGQLIGINSQILSPADVNIGLRDPTKNVMDQLIKTGHVRRAKLGVLVQRVTPDMATALGLSSAQGALVSQVDSGSPAARAGLKQGDVIVEFNGKKVNDSNQLRNEVASSQPGSTATLKVLRNGHNDTVSATLAEMPSSKERSSARGEHRGEGKFGMSVEPLTPDLAEQAGVGRSTQGVIVTGVDPDGAAEDAQLQEGDVIEKVDGRTVKTVDELKSALDRRDGKPSLLLVHRKDATIFLTLRAEQ